jgi:hypothetical protein
MAGWAARLDGAKGLGCAEIKEKRFSNFYLRFKIQIKRGLNILKQLLN